MELSSRAIASSSQGGTQFRGYRFLLSGGTPFRIPHLMSAGLYDQDGTQFRGAAFSSRGGTQFRGYRFLLPGRNSVPGLSLSPPRRNSVPGYRFLLLGRTQFRGICFFLPGWNSVPGCCFLLSGRNSVPGLSTFSYRGGTQFRLPTSDDYTIKRSCYKLQLLTNKNIVKRKIGCLNIVQGNQIEAACPLRRVLPSRRKKGWNSVPGVSASSSQGGTQFRGICFLLPRRNSVPG